MTVPTERVLWKANSGRRDWREGAPLRRLLGHAHALGLLSAVTWVKRSEAAEPVPTALQAGPDLADWLLAQAEPDEGVVELSAGGIDPAPWRVFWNACRFDSEHGVMGLNTLWFTFDRSRVADRLQSDRLLEAFMVAHTPSDTEYAVIHPYDHWSDFAEAHYRAPVTITPMFRGVYWANYLGGRHLEQFDLQRLADLRCQQLRWLDRTGLFFVTAPELSAADSRPAEAEMLRLSDYFQQALRPESPWAG